ncbi:hypothetical protein ABIB66_006414 [Bradyrhizobium sp. F1.13.3]
MLIAFKLKLFLACAAGLAGPIAVAPLVSDIGPGGTVTEPAIVRVAPGSLSYREAGDFTRGGQQAEAPLSAMRFERPLHCGIRSRHPTTRFACRRELVARLIAT